MRHVTAMIDDVVVGSEFTIETGVAATMLWIVQHVDTSWYSDFVIGVGAINDVTSATNAMHLWQQILIDGPPVAEQHVDELKGAEGGRRQRSFAAAAIGPRKLVWATKMR